MKVSDVMTRGVESVQSSERVTRAAELMRDFNVGAVPVFEGNREVGILTDRDIIVRTIAAGLDPNEVQIRDAMTRGVQACSEDDDLSAAARMMRERKIRRLLVRDSSGKICGIVSLGDVAIRGDHDISEEVLESVSEPAKPQR